MIRSWVAHALLGAASTLLPALYVSVVVPGEGRAWVKSFSPGIPKLRDNFRSLDTPADAFRRHAELHPPWPYSLVAVRSPKPSAPGPYSRTSRWVFPKASGWA